MKRLLLIICLLLYSSINAQWFWQNPLPQGNPLPSIYFTDMNTGWAVSSGGTIIKTTDGGANWESQYSGTNEFLLSVHFNDSNTGWVVGSNGLILKTTNGGVNWIGQSSGTSESLSEVFFIDSFNGWAVGGDWSTEMSIIINTTDGGLN